MRKNRFTLIEMLVVLVISGILLGLAIPAFEKLTVGSGVDAASRMVGGTLRLTRQYAIVHRQRIALLIPQVAETNGTARQFTQFRACEVTAGGQWVAWIPNTKWETLPVGAIVASVGTAENAASSGVPTDPPADFSPALVTGVPGFASGVRAVLFRPNGALVGDVSRYVWIAEGFPASTTAAKVRNVKNVTALLVNQYTGRTEYPTLDPVTGVPVL